MKVYLGGPMTGLPDYNYPAFHAAANQLREMGYDVFNPAESFDGDQSLDYSVYLKDAIQHVLDAEAMFVLPDWHLSKGTRVEVQVAQAAGLKVYEYPSGKQVQLEDMPIELEAASHVYGARQASYGHPATDFERTGRIWGAILGIDDVPPHLVALCMAGLKISREVNGHKRDNLVDGVGYLICAHRVIEEVAA